MADERPPGDSSLPLVSAECTGCGYPGKSRYPATYKCGACYYRARARGADHKATTLEARAKKLRAEAEVCRARERSFKARHPGAGG